MPHLTALLDAGNRERLFALELWKRGGVPDTSYWQFLEGAEYDPTADELVFGENRWRIEDAANP